MANQEEEISFDFIENVGQKAYEYFTSKHIEWLDSVLDEYNKNKKYPPNIITTVIEKLKSAGNDYYVRLANDIEKITGYQDKTKEDKAKEDKTKADKAKEDKAKAEETEKLLNIIFFAPFQSAHEKSVHVYMLSHSGTPKYQGKFDFRSFLMRIPNAIIVPYSPIDNPFPFLDVILPKFNSFLVIGEKIGRGNKGLTKDIHHIIWKQNEYYKFVPFLFTFPLKFTKAHLLKSMLIQPKNENQYELWKIRDHQLYEKIFEGSPDDQTLKKANEGQDEQNDNAQNKPKNQKIEFDSIVMMKIIQYETFNVKIHVRVSFYYVGQNSRYIGTPLIFGIENVSVISDLLHNFPKFAPKWVPNCEIRFLLKKNVNKNGNNNNNNSNQTSSNKDANDDFNYNDYLFLDEKKNENINEEPYFNVVCQLIDIDEYLKK